MKKIRYSVRHDDKFVHVRIIEQTHREDNFGERGCEFDCKNGITMSSVSCPCNNLRDGYMFFRGDSECQDRNIIYFNANEFELFKECVEEYNKWFSK
jgi:hypothetical protein